MKQRITRMRSNETCTCPACYLILQYSKCGCQRRSHGPPTLCRLGRDWFRLPLRQLSSRPSAGGLHPPASESRGVGQASYDTHARGRRRYRAYPKSRGAQGPQSMIDTRSYIAFPADLWCRYIFTVSLTRLNGQLVCSHTSPISTLELQVYWAILVITHS
jgi:hypothetical protein